MSLPSPRPELTSLLLEAIRRRDAATVARLTGQWAHRHGVTSLESFRTGSVVAEAGWEAGDWLLQHMDAAMAPASVTMAEAFAALEDSFAGGPPSRPLSVVPGNVVPFPAAPEAREPELEPEPLTDSLAAVAPAASPTAEAVAAPEQAPSAEPEPAADPAAGLSEAVALQAITPSSAPAPAPSTLADLRAWLSAAPQHRRAS